MIEEAYCSFEVARLLKEKGFNEVVRAYHNIYDKVNLDFRVSVDAPHLQIPCPTHQMAMAWLREKHIVIVIYPEYFNTEEAISYWGIDIWANDNYENLPGNYPKYEEAVEIALKYSLENLV